MLLDPIFRWLGYSKAANRNFHAAIQSRLTSDWVASTTTADSELRNGLKTMRDRCRSLERDNDYFRRWLKLVENNVIGHCGIGLQMKIKELGVQRVEVYDKRANDLIETHWAKWGERQFCSSNGAYSWLDVQTLAIRTTPRDGAVFIRKHYPSSNPYRFAIELIESDLLDTDHNATLSNGGVIRLGIEYDSSNRVAAYHMLRQHPGELFHPRMQGGWRERVPASEMIHIFRPERINQGTGFPWAASSVQNLRHLERYMEAELVAARSAASKMGFLVPQKDSMPNGYTGQMDSQGNKYMDVEPGSIEQLPYGYDFKAFDPTHPSTAFNGFCKAKLRQISSGLGVSYVSLANDLEGVNYSSIRAGLLEEREEWKSIQAWFIGWVVKPIFDEWLRMALASGAITDGVGQPLPASKFDKFNKPEFKPRRWAWVDPEKDINASVIAVEKGFTSRRAVISENGGDVEDVFNDIAADEALAESLDLDFTDAAQEPEMPEPALTNGKEQGDGTDT